MLINPQQLIELFEKALREGWGYIYGACGEVWTQAAQNAATREQTIKWGQRWVGHRVADCSGLFVWAFKQLGGYMYHGSNSMFKKYSTASGTLSGGRRSDGRELLPGTAVYKLTPPDDYHHVGLYIGNGVVIEAKGTAYGVVKSDVSIWHSWSELKGVNYYNEESEVIPMTVLYSAKVTTQSGPLNVRNLPNGKIVGTVAKDSVVNVGEVKDGWAHVQQSAIDGWCSMSFLTKIESQTESANAPAAQPGTNVTITIPYEVAILLRQAIIDQIGVG